MSTMDTLVESIVESNHGDQLTSAQLQALIGLLSTTSAVIIPRSHVLFQKLSASFADLSDSEESVLSIRLGLLLCSEAPHRDIVFSLIEAHSDAIESVVTRSIASLSAPQSSSAPLRPETEGEKILSYLVLIVLAAGEAKMKAKDLVEFIGGSVQSTVHVLVKLYADVGGTMAGIAPVASGSLQSYLSLRVVQMLHELTFWTTYDELHSRLGIGSNNQKALSRDTAGTSLRLSAGPYRYHVGQITSFLIQYEFFQHAVIYMSRLTRLLSERDVNSEAQLREHFLLFKSLLTQTDQFVGMLRKTVLKHGFLGIVCVSLMRALTSQPRLTTPHAALLQQCVDVAATLTFRSGDGHQFWVDNGSGLVEIIQGVTADAAAFAAAGGERMLAELVAQVARLVINSHSSAPEAAVLQLWEAHLDCAGKQRVAQRLSNPKSRSSPLDIFSPVYDALRPVLRIDESDSAVVDAQRFSLGSEGPKQDWQRDQVTLRDGGNRNRNRSRSRERGRSRSRRRSRSRQCRSSYRQRMKRRYQILAQRQSQSEKLDAATVELLDAVDADGSSSSSASHSEEEAAEAAVAAPDLTRWRHGPPPRSIPARYICSLSHAMIRSTPVLSSTGYVFDEDVILDYLTHYQVCPISGAPLSPSDLVVDTQLKEELDRVKANFL